MPSISLQWTPSSSPSWTCLEDPFRAIGLKHKLILSPNPSPAQLFCFKIFKDHPQQPKQNQNSLYLSVIHKTLSDLTPDYSSVPCGPITSNRPEELSSSFNPQCLFPRQYLCTYCSYSLERPPWVVHLKKFCDSLIVLPTSSGQCLWL